MELANHFAHVYSNQYGKAEPAFTREDMTRPVEYEWPGNVRELESCNKRG
jgi:DNA-binding NtrC family response regulator